MFPAEIATELRTAELSRVPDVVTTFAVPPVKVAVALEPTVRLPRVALAINVPPVTFDRPVTFPAVRVVVPLEMTVFRLPPDKINVADDVVAPVTAPPVMLAVPLTTSSSFNVALLMNDPPVTVIASAEPPVRLTDPLPTVTSPSVILDSNDPPVIFDRPMTLPPVRLVVPLVTRVFSVPPVKFRFADDMVVPVTDPPVTLAVPLVTVKLSRVIFVVRLPPVTFDRPLTAPPVKLTVPLDVRVFNVPPVRFNVPDVVVVPVTAPPVIVAVPVWTSS